MTDKRKQLIRELAEKAGVSHAGAANLLDKGKPHITRKPFTVDDLFAKDHFDPPTGTNVGGFVRGASEFLMFNKSRDETVFVIGEGGDNILSIQRANHAIVPLLNYFEPDVEDGWIYREASTDIDATIAERMLAVLDSIAVSGFDSPNRIPEIPASQVEAHFLEHFAGQGGVLHVFNSAQTIGRHDPLTYRPDPSLPGLVLCVRNQAGVLVTDGRRFGFIGFGRRCASVKLLPG